MLGIEAHPQLLEALGPPLLIPVISIAFFFYRVRPRSFEGFAMPNPGAVTGLAQLLGNVAHGCNSWAFGSKQAAT